METLRRFINFYIMPCGTAVSVSKKTERSDYSLSEVLTNVKNEAWSIDPELQ